MAKTITRAALWADSKLCIKHKGPDTPSWRLSVSICRPSRCGVSHTVALRQALLVFFFFFWAHSVCWIGVSNNGPITLIGILVQHTRREMGMKKVNKQQVERDTRANLLHKVRLFFFVFFLTNVNVVFRFPLLNDEYRLPSSAGVEIDCLSRRTFDLVGRRLYSLWCVHVQHFGWVLVMWGDAAGGC